MTKRFNPVLEVVSGMKIAISMVFIFGVSGVYMYVLNESIVIAVLSGIVGMIFGFYHSVYLPEKLKRKLALLKDLQNYSTTMTFYLKSGYNVYHSFEKVSTRVSKEVASSVRETMKRLDKDAKLDTSSFEEHQFNSLNVFHEILDIKYDKGGSAKEMFTRANGNINFEITKYDELFRMKNARKKQILLMMGAVLGIPLMLRFMASDLYSQFLSVGAMAVGLNFALFIACLISLYFLQKNATNISI